MQDFRRICKRIVLFEDDLVFSEFFERFACGDVFDLRLDVGGVVLEDDDDSPTLSVRILTLMPASKPDCINVQVKTMTPLPLGFIPGTYVLEFEQCGSCYNIPKDMMLKDEDRVRVSTNEFPAMDLGDF